ncbi:MAG: sigma-70 family RNA polymerase sigma factor [Syntrophomonadaceae bacterium]|jgi:RNA polymerase sigma-70 factor (ECF subfamily)|nr:sigma-70 family RNA polymerase sigma factor [Syntrophomonadaceae bacterium]
MGSMDEEKLIQLSKNGNLEAFEELVNKYQNEVHTLAYRYMKHEEDAYDTVQEVFIKIYCSLNTFMGKSKFSAWMYKVAKNTCLDELRRKKRRLHAISLDDTFVNEQGDNVNLEIPDSKALLYEIYEHKIQADNIHKILDEMKKEQKNILILKYVMEYSYAEIGALLNCSVESVKSRLFRARFIFKQKAVQLENRYMLK